MILAPFSLQLGWLGTPSPPPSESAEPASSSSSLSALTDFGTFLTPTPESPIRPVSLPFVASLLFRLPQGRLSRSRHFPSLFELSAVVLQDAYGFDCQRREMEEVEAATSHSAPATFRPPAPMDNFAHALADALEPYAEEVEETLEAPKVPDLALPVPPPADPPAPAGWSAPPSIRTALPGSSAAPLFRIEQWYRLGRPAGL
ncbi:hypothetical protein Rhopal_007346-T1 [Rhodotorula paludigena]|uniref:Uncharacterized protein n=1 Tax=Rhodotorula paludigena TaxID=86838 RepID=A0AAV5GY45_9BASI|nr:hypothetical protein Rhopal_007346-T1 [Rhodotorula paludigena]